MLLRFTKMHGLGNDFVVFDAVTQNFRLSGEQIRYIANRYEGIGCDQVLIVEPPTDPEVDFHYRIYNSDGNEVEQCGNGARCFAKFVTDKRLTGRNPIRVSTRSGVISLELVDNHRVRVDMGVPAFEPATIPFNTQQQGATYTLDIDGSPCEFSALSMGNPHAVLRVDAVSGAPVKKLGGRLGSHPAFPQGVNVGFMEIVGRRHIRLRVFERGAGETRACGTGACAAVVAGIQRGLLDNEVEVDLTGGSLIVGWEGPESSVIMTGTATKVFEGKIRL